MKRAHVPWTMTLVVLIGCGGNHAQTGATTPGSRGAATRDGGAMDVTSNRNGGHESDAEGAMAESTGGASADAGETGTVSTWVADLIAAYCARAARCGEYRDAATCKVFDGRQIDAINFNQGPAAVRSVLDGKAQFDPTQAASCLSAISNLDCDFDIVNPPSIPEPCLAVFSGGVSDGDVCVDEVACSRGSVCDVFSTMTCEGRCMPAYDGKCLANADCAPQQYCSAGFRQGSGLWGSGKCETLVPPGASAGELCGTPVQCAPGLSPGGGPAPCRCGPAAEVGERCGGFVGPSCAPDLACVFSDDAKTSTCMIPAKLGEPCTSLFQCGAQYKLSDIICDTKGSHSCVRKPSKGPCVYDVYKGGVNTCDPVTSYCEGPSLDGGTCKPWLPQGAACTTGASFQCGMWNTCRDGVCAPELGACTPN